MEVKLVTVERVCELLNYNPETGEFVRAKVGKIAGSRMTNGYRIIGVDGKGYLAHRLAWLVVHSRWPDGNIDHINGDRADNRIANLRECNQAQNMWNHNAAWGRSGIRGVHWSGQDHKRQKKWVARLKVNGRTHNLGRFATKEEAAEAYKDAAIRLHGTFYRDPG
jgi:hypothetical protein